MLGKLSLKEATCLGVAVFKVRNLPNSQVHTGLHDDTRAERGGGGRAGSRGSGN